MCGRFSLHAPIDDLRSLLNVPARGAIFDLLPRYNITPSQEVAAVRIEGGERRLVLLRWGLVPFWANDPATGYKTINARAEKVHQSPAFRAAFRSRRCIVPASGFFEWDKAGGTRQPFNITRADGQLMALAGLWEHWEDEEGKTVIESCAVLTTEANEEVARLHNRMPVILEPGDFDLWLDPDEHRPERLRPLLYPAPAGTLTMYPVSSYVNKATNEGKRCVEAVAEKGK